MNKIIITFILTLLYINPILSQNSQGYIIYKKENLSQVDQDERFKDYKQRRPEYYQKVLLIQQKAQKLLKDIEFKLSFSKDESFFEVSDFLNLNNDGLYGLAIGPYGSGKYYMNIIKEEYYWQLDAYGDKFLIKNPKITWVLYNETKKIGKYVCFKAKTIKLTKGRTGIIKTPITVWYTSELPIPFGPIGYGGLPGLILELEIKESRFIVAKIVLNPQNKITIRKPKEGILLNKDEFEEFGLKAIENYRKN